MTITEAAHHVQVESAFAQGRFGDFTSTAEAIGVLTEEHLELIEAVRSNDRERVAQEAKQVSAVALRLFRQAMDTSDDAFAERSGFVK